VPEPLRIFAAGSLRPAFDVLAELWPEPVELRYANALVLAEAILAGEPADVFASASPHEPARLAGLGIAEPARAFARNHLVVAVPADSAIDSVAALAEPGTRVVLEVPGIPLGDYTRELLDRLDEVLGGGYRERVLANLVVEGDNVFVVAGHLTAGDADAGILYVTDVAASGGRLRPIEPPDDAAVRATYVDCALRDAPRPDAARAWLDMTHGDIGQRALRQASFDPPR
jgi:molybdate transport system substrate-binding protein